MRIGTKLTLVCLAAAALIALLALATVAVLETGSRKDTISGLQDQAAMAMGQIDKNIHNRVEEIQWYAEVTSLAKQARLSSDEFDGMANVENHIKATDGNWIDKKDTPFIRGILDNQISRTLNRHIVYLNQREYPVFTEMYLTNKYGVIIGSTGRTSDYLQADEAWYQAAVAQRGVWIGDVEYDESSDSFALDLVVSLHDDDGNLAGVLKGVLNLDDTKRVVNLVQSDSHHKSANAYLVNKNGRAILGAQKPSRRGTDLRLEEFGEDLSSRNAVAEALRASDGFVVFTDGDTESLAVFSRSKGHEEYQGSSWTLIVEYDMEEVLHHFRTAKRFLLVGSIVLTTLAMLGGLFFSRSISVPIKRLTATAAEIASGDRSVRCGLNRNDEIGQLAVAFDKMAAVVEETLGNLEGRVKERTAELTKAVQQLRDENAERERAEQALRQRSYDLGERIKELNCLHGISRLLENADTSVQDVIQKTIALIPSSWQCPEITSVRIILDGDVFETGNFEETPWKQSASILVNDKWAGTLNVCYLEERPQQDEGPFTKEERALLNTIAQRLGQFIERNKAETEVRSLKQQMEFILGATKTGLHIIDSDYSVRYVDPEWRKIYGDPTGRKCYEYFDGYSKPCGDCRLAEALETNSITVTEKRLSKENDRPIQETSIPFQNQQGEWLVAQVNVDISERKRMERELTQAQRLEAIGHLAAGIAHEINTPTQYIGDNTRFLQDAFGALDKLLGTFQRLLQAAKEGPVTDDLVTQVEAALGEADVDYLTDEIPGAIRQSLEGLDRVASIVRAMKEFSHPGGKQKQAIDLNRAIESTLTVSRNEWKYVADLVTDFDPNLPLVPCLPGDFNQVMLNLVVNSAQAIADVVGDDSKDKGTITVSTRHDGDWAEIRVEDTGPGIPEGIRSKIFDHFFTTKDVGKGTGQGLTIARSIVVEKHGGALTFETETGRGTTFFIRLPINDQSPATEDTQPEEMQAIS